MKKITTEKKIEIARLYKLWLSIKEIAYRMCVTNGTIKKYLIMQIPWIVFIKKPSVDEILKNNPDEFDKLRREYMTTPVKWFTSKYRTWNKRLIEIFWHKWHIQKHEKFHKEQREKSNARIEMQKMIEQEKRILPKEASVSLPITTFDIYVRTK